MAGGQPKRARSNTHTAAPSRIPLPTGPRYLDNTKRDQFRKNVEAALQPNQRVYEWVTIWPTPPIAEELAQGLDYSRVKVIISEDLERVDEFFKSLYKDDGTGEWVPKYYWVPADSEFFGPSGSEYVATFTVGVVRNGVYEIFAAHTAFMSAIPPWMCKFIEDVEVFKVFHAGSEDVKKLRFMCTPNLRPASCTNVVDAVNVFRRAKGLPEHTRPGLSVLTEEMLDIKLPDAKHKGRPWNERCLKPGLVHYLFKDVWGVGEVLRSTMVKTSQMMSWDEALDRIEDALRNAVLAS